MGRNGVHGVRNENMRELERLLPVSVERVSMPLCHYSARDAAMALAKCASLPCLQPQANLIELYVLPSCLDPLLPTWNGSVAW